MKRLGKYFALFFIIILICNHLVAQNTIGLPDIINYSRDSYHAGTQNWDIKQDNSGIMYFANNEGLLIYDGKYWNLTPLPNKTIVRSLEIARDNNIYVGGQDEFGYFVPDNNGQLRYHSLIGLLPKNERSFGDVWDIQALGKDIYFRTNNKIFIFSNQSISIFKATSEWTFLGACNGIMYAHDYRKGLLYFSNNIWNTLLPENPLDINDPVTAVLPAGERDILIATLKNGIYRFASQGLAKIISPTMQTIQKERIYGAVSTADKKIIIATNLGGIYVIDQEGNLIQKFSKKEGLQNDNALSVFIDKKNNIWAGLDNGIDCVLYGSPIKHITPNEQNASGYAAIVHRGKLFIGNSGGLFETSLQKQYDLSFSKGYFGPVNNTTGQVWSLADINGQLLMGHHEGAFLIENGSARSLGGSTGYWNFTPTSTNFPSPQLIAGNYKGLQLFDYTSNSFSPGPFIDGFAETSRFVAIDELENTWVSHPYHGVYKVFKSPQGNYLNKAYGEKEGLPLTLNNHVYKIKNKVLIATEKGIYTYNYEKDRFEKNPFYNDILGELSIRYIQEDPDGNLWFIHEKNLGVIDFSGKKPTVIYLPELNNKMLSGFEFIYPINKANILLAGEQGFYHINYEKYKNNDIPEPVLIRSVKITNEKDSVLFGGYFNNINLLQKQKTNAIPEIQAKWNSIQFEFSSPSYGKNSGVYYSYQLKGFDKGWSEWTEKAEKNYTNLPPGRYVFQVKAKTNFGKESGLTTYTFRIKAPWYRTGWAFTLYLLIFFAILYFLYFRMKKKYINQQLKLEEDQKKLTYLHALEMQKAESELISLRNEKLQRDIDFKNSELATNAMHLVKKGELLTKIKSELNQMAKSVKNEDVAAELKKMIKFLSDDEKMDKDWEHFAQHFDKVHSDFSLVLKEKHPELTHSELKLCTYLRMNLSSKEIAQLLNITVRGVEISRYRLRKKLGIAKEVNLFDYLIGMKK